MKKMKQKRFCVLYICTIFFAVAILVRLYVMQMIGGVEAKNIVDSRLSLSIPVSAPRGEITDRYGRVLAKSKIGYFIVAEKKSVPKETQQQAILAALSLLSEEEKKRYTDSVPISFEVPFTYLDTEKKEAFQKEFEFLKTLDAKDAIWRLCQRFQISDSFSETEKRLLVGVYIGMQEEGFSVSVPYTLAEDVSPETITRIKEHQDMLPTVSVQERFVREYLYPETAVHILGRVGKISREEYEEKKEEGYKRTDYIGKQGAEKTFEKELKGADGIRAISQNADYVTPKDPVAGNTVILTLDLELQKATEDALQDAVSRTYLSEKNGAAAVVIDVHSGEILASASYPSYDVTAFHTSYNALQQDPAKPMFHRSLSGLYAPGSTFKPLSAIAAIDSGSMEPEEKLETKGEYDYLDRTFRCNIFRTKGETHGTIGMPEAIGVSCNYYFYELGRRTGIDAISKTARAFGLGSTTGEETASQEAKGKIATPELKKQMGGTWYPGDVLQAAIGQSDHLCTPIQLANYAAALANGGTLYKTKLQKSIKSGTDGRILSQSQPEIARKIQVSEKALEAVREGMQLVTAEGGTAGSVFLDFPLTVAGKTGSAQVPGGTNGLFIGYAPAENPQIALSVVIENGGAGTLAALAAKNIFTAYFEKPTFVSSQVAEPYTIRP